MRYYYNMRTGDITRNIQEAYDWHFAGDSIEVRVTGCELPHEVWYGSKDRVHEKAIDREWDNFKIKAFSKPNGWKRILNRFACVGW